MSDRPRFDLLIRHGLSVDRLQAALRADPAIRTEAEAELAATRGVHEDRCVMTKEYRAALTRALA